MRRSRRPSAREETRRPPLAGPPGRLERVGRLDQCRAGNPAGAIYGMIVIGAAARGQRADATRPYIETVGSAVIAAVLYWLAHCTTRRSSAAACRRSSASRPRRCGVDSCTTWR